MARLSIVPTPIGNLEDITIRALRVLKEADIILAEDTRTTGFLLKHFEISTKLISHHKFNEHATLQKTIDLIDNGNKVALVSDAGTPSISDPGFLLVRECIRRGIEVDCLPGPTAFVPALVNSGFSTDHFCFEGFLPQKKGRQTRLLSLKNETRTIILYESPYRLSKTLEQIIQFWGDRNVSVSREITKFHEETIRGVASVVLEHFKSKPPKGEIVIVIEGCQTTESNKRKKNFIDDISIEDE